MNMMMKIYGPYKDYIFVNGFLFISGQLGVNSNEENIVSIEEETKNIMKNIKIILNKKKMDFDNAVKTSIFLKNIKNYDIINKIYSSFFFKNNFPARETVQVSGLPKNANIEISMIAYRKNS